MYSRVYDLFVLYNFPLNESLGISLNKKYQFMYFITQIILFTECAQTQQIMGNSLERPVCCKNGNFREIQCRRGICRCVDPDGRQVYEENSDVTKLRCFNPNQKDWREC